MPRQPHRTDSPKRILLCQSEPIKPMELEMIKGIRRYALNRPDWEIGFLNPNEVKTGLPTDLQGWNPHGMIVVAHPAHVKGLLSTPKIPTVLVDHQKKGPETVTRIRMDDETTGRKAAAYFLRNRFRDVAVVSQANHAPFSTFRMRGFRRELREHGIQAHSFALSTRVFRPWKRNPGLENWLKQLPTPIGIYAVTDSLAQQVIEHAKHVKLRIPGDLSVLGSGNDTNLCEVIRPSLSSIPQPFEACGYRSAAVLDEHMHLWASGKTPPIVCETLQPTDVIERQSSNLRAIPDPAIASAVQYLKDRTLHGGTIDEAARIAGLNRRALERGFQRHLEMTPGQYMTGIKLDHAKELLAGTDLRMWEIADACGMTQDHFSYLFRTTTGITPSAYRRGIKQMGNG